jgi:hypothetical protein
MAMSDTNNQLLDQLLLEGSGAVAYGTGVGILTVYPQAEGYYRAYFAANATRAIDQRLRNAIGNAGLQLLEVDRVAAPIPITSPDYAPGGLNAARLGNNAVVDAVDVVSTQYGRNLSDLRYELTSVPGYGHNSFSLANGQTVRVDLSYRTSSLWSGATQHFDEVKAKQNLTASPNNLR